MTGVFADAAGVFLAEYGESVTFVPNGQDPAPLTALVEYHGYGAVPAGWPGEPFFEGQGRYAEFQVRPADLAAEPTIDDEFQYIGRTFEIRMVRRVPPTGPDQAWWSCLCVANQRGGA